MKNEIKIFDFENNAVRVMTINDEPWFSGKDVATVLGYSNASKAIYSHVDDEDKTFVMLDIADSQNRNVLVGKSKTVFINEGGIYSLVFASKLPTAKQFKRWVTSEVLPTLRKTGGYINNTQLFIDTYFSDVDDAQKSLIANCMNQISEKQKQINLMQPKYDYCNEILTTENVVPITVIAKDYGMSATKMNQLLKDLDVQYKVGGVWVLKKKYANKGYTATKTGTPENGGYSYTHTYWTQAGRFFIYNLLKEHGIVPLVEQNNNKALTVNH